MPTNRINHEVENIEDHDGFKTEILELNSTKNEKSFLLVDNSRKKVSDSDFLSDSDQRKC